MTNKANTATYGTTNAIAQALSDPCRLNRRGGRRDWLIVKGPPNRRACCVLLIVTPRALPAAVALPLHATHGQARRHVASEPVIQDDRRQRVDDRGRHHVVPWRFIAVEELC